MAKRVFIVVAVFWLLGMGRLGQMDVSACGAAPCAEQFDFCNETAEAVYGQYLECCTGFCRGPHGPYGCNNDSNQCICLDYPSPQQ